MNQVMILSGYSDKIISNLLKKIFKLGETQVIQRVRTRGD
jgi:hypothetical protein